MSAALNPSVDRTPAIKLLGPDVSTAVWGFLVIASLVTFWLGSSPELNPRSVVAGILFLAFVKAWFVGVYFMETRRAIPALARAFTIWLTVSSVGTLTIVLFG